MNSKIVPCWICNNCGKNASGISCKCGFTWQSHLKILSILADTQEQIKFPDFDKIIMHSKTLMSLNFPKYKNSWTDCDYEFQQHQLKLYNEFWNKRLLGEVDEFLQSTNVEDARKELADIISVCSMIYEKCIYTPDRHWRYG